jgi:hypothetical protein
MISNTSEKSILLRTYQLIRDNLFTAVVIIALTYGWLHRDDNYLSAETGTGYVLGIIGGSLMLVLLMYPVSKRVGLLTRMLPIRYWFGIHMLFGIIGPLLVLFHSNFHMGSTNSSIALFCMLVVAASGIIGRFIYTRIYDGLYGARLSLTELKNETKGNHVAISHLFALDEQLASKYNKVELVALRPYTALFASIWRVIKLGVASRLLQRRSITLIRSHPVPAGVSETAKPVQENHQRIVGSVQKHLIKSVKRYMKTLRKTASFQVYERLFSLWHILHLPLFIMMIITAVVHVFAVHLY